MAFDEEFLTEQEVADLFKVSRKTLYNWRKEGIGPNYMSLPSLRYPKKSLIAWYNKQLVQTNTTALVINKRTAKESKSK